MRNSFTLYVSYSKPGYLLICLKVIRIASYRRFLFLSLVHSIELLVFFFLVYTSSFCMKEMSP